VIHECGDCSTDFTCRPGHGFRTAATVSVDSDATLAASAHSDATLAASAAGNSITAVSTDGDAATVVSADDYASACTIGTVTLISDGLGGGIFDGTAEEVVLSSVMQGYRLIDTAANYGTEAAIGRALKRSGVPREECFLVSKALTGGYEKTVESFRRSLASLDTPYLDAFLMHGAAATGVRDLRSPEHARARLETWRAMRDLRCEGGPPYRGCARAIGVCNHSPRQVERLMEVAKPAIHQIEFTPLLQRNATLAQCAAHGIVCQG